MKKKIIIFLVILALLLSIASYGLYYLNTYYLPKIIKAKIIEQAQEKLGVVTQIEDIKLNLLKGIVFYKIGVLNKDGTPALEVNRLSVTFLPLPSIKQKKIILPSLNIEGLKLDIIRYQDNRFNIQDFIPKQQEPAENTAQEQENANQTSMPFIVLLHKIHLSDSEISFSDKTLPSNSKQILKLDDFKAQLSAQAVNFNLQGAFQSSPLNLNGKFQFDTKELKINSRLERLDALPYLNYIKDLPVEIKSLSLADINTAANFDLSKNNLYLKIGLDIKDTNLTKDDSSISNASAKLKTTLIIDFENIANLDYIINIDKLKANFSNRQIHDEIEITNAKLNIVPDKLDIQDLKLIISQIPVDIKGNLENFINPVFNISAKTQADISTLKGILEKYFPFVKEMAIEGNTNLDLNILKTKDKDYLNLNGILGLKNCSFKSKNLPFEINAINGLVNISNESLQWENLSFSILEQNFKSKVSISNFRLSIITLNLKAEKINISAKINTKQNNLFEIEYLNAGYFNSKLNAEGDLDLGNKNNIYADLDVKSEIDLRDLKQIKYIPQENILKMNPEGICKISGRIKGDLKNPKLLTALLNLNNEELNFYGLKLKNLQAQIAQEEQQIKIPQSSLDFYGGTIAINGLIDLEKQGLPYALKAQADNIDFSLLKLDTQLKEHELQGILTATLILSGQANSLLETLKGQGEFLIADGYLWEFDPLKKLGDFLFIPKYDSIIFKQAKGNFNIYDEKAVTDDLLLSSDDILLSCEGSIDFKGNLDLDITPKPTDKILGSPQGYEKFIAGIFSEAGGIVTVKLKGTIQKPEFEKKIIIMKVLDKVKDGVIDKIKEFKDLIFGTEE